MVAPFVGRVPELATLQALMDEVAAGTPRVVAVVGPPGIGKSALVQRFLDSRPGAPTLRATCDETETMLPYGVVAQLVAPSRREVADSPGSDPIAVGVRLLDLLGALQDEGPVAVAVDDVQWADLPSAQAIAFALRRLVADRVLAVFTVREDDAAALPSGLRRAIDGHRGATLRLGGLDDAELRELMGAMQIAVPSADAVRALREGTLGNPLYARAVLREHRPEAWSSPDAGLPAPLAFQRLVRDRVGALSEPGRQLVEAAAVLGVTGDVALAARLAGLEDPLPALDELSAAELVAMADPRHPRAIAFRHPLLRSAVHAGIAPSRRVALHAAAAALVPDEAAVLRHRIAAAPAADSALADDLVAVAERDVAAGAWPNAATRLVEASRVDPPGERRHRLLLRAVHLMLISGDVARATGFAAEVAALPGGPLRDSVLGHLAIVSGAPAEAERLLAQAWHACDAGTDPELAATIALQNAVHWHARLRGAQTVEWSARARALAPARSPTAQVALTHEVFGLVYAGRDRGAAQLLDRAFDGGLQSLVARGWLRLLDDDLDGARADLQAAASAASPRGIVNSTAFGYAHRARVEYFTGAWDEAVVSAQRAIAVNTASDSELIRGLVFGAAVLVPAARGDHAAAADLARRATPTTGGYERVVVAAALARAFVCAAQADAEAVVEALAPVVEMSAVSDVAAPGIWPWPGLYAEALVDLGRVDEADHVLRPHEALAAARGRRSAVANMARARGRIEAAAGRIARARAAFAEGHRALAGLPVPFERALLRHAEGDALTAAKADDEAAPILQSALETFTALGAVPYRERVDRALARCGRARSDPERKRYRESLTSQESVIARLVADGRTNREVAAELFLSVKTVEFHLANVFRKLGIRSRRQLRTAL